MCGYFGNLHECPAIIDLMNQLQIPLPYPEFRNNPSFGGACESQGLVTYENGVYHLSNAIWWYDRDRASDTFKPSKYTSFNARNLEGRMWKNAIKTRRGLVFASELGESNGKKGKEAARHLMRSQDGFALGCLFKDWENTDGSTTRSFAVITRDPHDRFKKYHEKAFPLFLPNDPVAIKEWLDPEVETSPIIEEILNDPKLPVDLEVTRVKTFKNAEPLGEAEILEKDRP